MERKLPGISIHDKPSRLNILKLKMNYEGARGKLPDLDKFDIELRQGSPISEKHGGGAAVPPPIDGGDKI